MPGANDSASGVAVLLEVARAMTKVPYTSPIGVDFVFFDGEEGLPEQGSQTNQWRPLGSDYFAANINALYPETLPIGGIIADMVCDRDLGIIQEASSLQSAPEQVKKFWEIGNKISPGTFKPANNQVIRDDHTALNRVGIPSFVVIDLTYPPYHTQADTPDKCSPNSLTTVARTIISYTASIQ